MSRILITGASGLLGLNLALAVNEKNQVIGVDRCKLIGVPFDMVCADLLESGAIGHILDTTRPDLVIHCAAMAIIDTCEQDPELARNLNADLPGKLALASHLSGIQMIHISTDSVFDGSKQNEYTEDDHPNPQSTYSATKLQGEQNVLAANPEALVARVNFFGWSLSGKRSISEFFFNALSTGQQCNGFTDVWFCPMFVGHLAGLLMEMVEKGLKGLYHAVGSSALTKYEFGLHLARRFGFNENLITPISIENSGLSARRSPTLKLSVHKLSTALGREIPGVSTGLDEFYTQYQQGYPQKMRSYQQAASTGRTS